MASCMIRNDDTGLIYYWSPESGNVPLTHPDQARLLGMPASSSSMAPAKPHGGREHNRSAISYAHTSKRGCNNRA